MDGLLGFDPEQLKAMMAQFGATPQDTADANKQAAFALGFGLLQGRKGNELATIGQAGMGAMGVRQGALADAQRGKLQSVQTGLGLAKFSQELEAMKQQQAQQKQMQDLTQRSFSPGLPQMGPPTAGGEMQSAVPPTFDKQKYGTGLWQINPDKALAFEQAQARESPFAKIDPSKFTQESVAKFARSGNPGDLQSVEAQTVGKLNPSDFTPASMATYARSGNYADLVPIDKRPMTNVSVKNFAETEYDKTIGKSSAEAYVGYQTTGRNADAQISRLNAIDNLLRGVDTNSLTPVGMSVAGKAKAIGLTLDPNLPAKQAAEALSNEMALASRQGGQMPGAMSDKDREFLQAMNPNLGQTPEGRALLIDTRKKTAQREKEVARLAREYASKHDGRLDSGFDSELATYADAHPLFGGMTPTNASGYRPTPAEAAAELARRRKR